MRLTAIGLILLGIVAAGAAAVLIAAFRFTPETRIVEVQPKVDTVEIVVAGRDLDPLSPIQSDDVLRQAIPKEELTADLITSSMAVIGKSPRKAMVAGEPFREGGFILQYEGIPIPQGYRWHQIAIDSSANITHFLYPGCYVDIIGNFKNLPNIDDGRATLTLMQRVQVLSVGIKSVLDSEVEDVAPRPGTPANWLTVLVTPDEVEFLTMAASLGEFSVTLRDPSERDLVDPEGMGDRRFSQEVENRLARAWQAEAAKDVQASPEAEEPAETPLVAEAPLQPGRQTIQVIKGSNVESVEVDAEESSSESTGGRD